MSAARRHHWRHRRMALSLLLTLSTLLAGCGSDGPPWALRDISGLLRPLQFSLHDSDGQPRHADDYHGKLVLLYFGYTHCPDVCPTTLATVTQAIRRLGDNADRVRLLFVSVDPSRDTPAVLKRYANAFGPQVVGLSGSQQQLQALSKRYRLSYGYDQPDAKGRYAVSHSSAVFIFDADGQGRLLGLESAPSTDFQTDLERLLAETTPSQTAQ